MPPEELDNIGNEEELGEGLSLPELSPDESAASLAFANMLSGQMMPQEAPQEAPQEGQQEPQNEPEATQMPSAKEIQVYIDEALEAKFDELKTMLSEALQDDEEEEPKDDGNEEAENKEDSE